MYFKSRLTHVFIHLLTLYFLLTGTSPGFQIVQSSGKLILSNVAMSLNDITEQTFQQIFSHLYSSSMFARVLLILFAYFMAC